MDNKKTKGSQMDVGEETFADKVFPEKETVSKPVPKGEEVSHYMKIYKRGKAGKRGGKLSSGSKVKSRKQAIAIGLSVARQHGADVPAPPVKVKKKAKKSIPCFSVDHSILKAVTVEEKSPPKLDAKKGSKVKVFGAWEAIPHGRVKGGMRRWLGTRWEYKYPSSAAAGQAKDHHMQQGQAGLGKAASAHSALMDAFAGKSVPMASILNHPEHKKYKEHMELSQHHYAVAHNAAAMERNWEKSPQHKVVLTPAERKHLRLLAAHAKEREKVSHKLPKVKAEDSKEWLRSQKRALQGKRDLLDKLHKELAGLRNSTKKSFEDLGSLVKVRR